MMRTRRQFLLGGGARSKVPGAGKACLQRQGVVCQACRDTCFAGAIAFLPLAGGRAAPVIDPARCNGCGDCLPACPVGAIAFEPALA